MISPAERESTYVIDGLMHNDVVKSTLHSTDEHGFKEAISCLTHLLGISYAPSFRNLKRQTPYHFRNRRNASGQEVPRPLRIGEECAEKRVVGRGKTGHHGPPSPLLQAGEDVKGASPHVMMADPARTSSRLRASRPQTTATRWTGSWRSRYLSA